MKIPFPKEMFRGNVSLLLKGVHSQMSASVPFWGDRFWGNLCMWGTERRNLKGSLTPLKCACLKQNFLLLAGEGKLEGRGAPTCTPQVVFICPALMR